MKISSPEILQQNGETVYRVGVETSAGTDTLWYSVPEQFGDLITDSCDAPLVALLIPAMALGEDIHVAGKLSERLLYALSRPYQRLMQHVIPSLRQVSIHPTEIQSGFHKRSAVATGFSGGIDSFCVLADHYYSEVPAGFKVTHLLFNNVGSHGAGERSEQLFRARYARTAPVAARIGLPLVRVDSNVHAFYEKKTLGFQRTHTPRNASVALLLQRGVGRYLYASGLDYTHAFVGATHDTAYSDVITLPLLSTELLDALSVGSEYTRVEKTLRVAAVADSHNVLDVCTHPRAGNCSECWKCMRTLLTLEIAGLLESYSPSFDLDKYARRRNRYIREVLVSNEPLLREIVRFAKQRDFAFPLSSRLHARMMSMTGPPVRAARKLKIASQEKG